MTMYGRRGTRRRRCANFWTARMTPPRGWRSGTGKIWRCANGRMQAFKRDPNYDDGQARLRRVREDGRFVGAPAAVPDLRARGLLRFVEEQTRHQAFPPGETSAGAFD